MKNLLLLFFCLLLVGGLSACQTARGFGEDLSTLGDRISADAEDHMDD